MDITDAVAMLDAKLIIIAVFLWCIGFSLKKAPAFTEEWKIPFFLTALGIVATFCYMAFVLGQGASPATITLSVIQGTLAAAIAVYGNEMVKQALFKRMEDNTDD